MSGPNEEVLEDSGLDLYHEVVGWATNISSGPLDESGQNLTFTVINYSNELFSDQPFIYPNGTLTYTLAANANGIANVEVVLSDNGGVDYDGVETSDPHAFFIIVESVNDAPSFTAGENEEVLEDSGFDLYHEVVGWATNISSGPPDESGQTLNFNVGNTTNGLFSIQPSIDSNGTLTYTLTADAHDTCTVTVSLLDNGDVDDGGIDTSDPQQFIIVVTPVPDKPSITNASTYEDSLTTNGIVITRNPVDGEEVTHFKITNMLHGRLFINGDTTNQAIETNSFVLVEDGNSGLYYLPDENYNGPDSIFVQGSLNHNNQGLGGELDTGYVEIIPVNDYPIAYDDTILSFEGFNIEFDLAGDDGDTTAALADIQEISFQIVTPPTYGQFGYNESNGHIWYQLDSTDSDFKYKKIATIPNIIIPIMINTVTCPLFRMNKY